MSLISMGFLWTGSQIPLYLWGSVPPYIYRDIGGVDRWIWFVLGGLLALAAVCPFVGSMSDLMGRRYVALLGAGLLIIATVVATTAKTMNTFICGMTIAGAGAGIGELTALAATAELAPTAKRGTYVSILIFTIIPFVPSGIYAQLIACEFHQSCLEKFTDSVQLTLGGDTSASSCASGTGSGSSQCCSSTSRHRVSILSARQKCRSSRKLITLVVS